jgi:putative two-component system response regulator
MPNALIIDDNRQIVEYLRQMLLFLGVDCEVANGARTGMLKVTKVPDVVFLDIHMPGVDGFEVLAYIRRHPMLDKTPVVFITSDDQKETAKKAKDSGVLNLIVKPITMEMIEDVLQKLDLL